MSNDQAYRYKILKTASITTVKQLMREPRVDYAPIYKALEEMDEKKTLILEVSSQSKCQLLRNAIARWSKDYICTQRRRGDGFLFFISRREEMS